MKAPPFVVVLVTLAFQISPAQTSAENDVLQFERDACKAFRTNRVDETRIYVTGHSMGGRGALYLAYKFPMRFAAVVAMSPLSPITAWAKQLRNVPVWLIHGAKDNDAPIKDSEELIRAIEQSGGRPKFTSLADRDHFILDLYDRNDVFDWMKEHAR